MATYTVIRGGRLLDIKGHRADAQDILIEGDSIAAIGAPGMAAPSGATIVDASDRLMHPGLINAHTHGHGNLAKGMGDRWTLELLLTAAPWTGGNRTLEDKYLTTLIGGAEMLLKGCTSCYDLYYEFPAPTVEGLDAVGRAYRDIGMRSVIAPMVASQSFYESIPGLMEALPAHLQKAVTALAMAPAETTVATIRQALHGWKHDRDHCRLAVAPTIPLHCSDAFMGDLGRLAREYGVGLHSHVGESKVQAVSGLRRYGKTLLAHLDDLGLVGPDFTAAHAVWLDDDDMRRLGDKGGSIAHNPGSNMRLGNGLANIRRMLERQVNVGIGTDAASCSDNLNMYESLKLASMVSKVQGPDQRIWLSTEEVVRAATEGSARALGFERAGRIAPGYKADIVFLDTHAINWIPFNDPTNQLVHCEDGTSVADVMVGGRHVVKDRKLVACDLGKLAREVEAARQRLERANAENKRLFDRLEPVVGTFCPGLSRQPYHIDRFGAHSQHSH
jgi:5-methylthioadenosine/S-adenosylhomocysteine deaminase